MDPNSNLRDLRKNVQEALRVGYDSQVYEAAQQAGFATVYDQLLTIAEDFDNLDEWLRKGGFLPQDWQDAQEVAAFYGLTYLEGQ
jgi:type II secretory pathway component PulF